MFSQMRRQDRELGPAETAEILRNGTYGVLSINGPADGYAYGVPMSYVYSEGSIYIHCATEGKKLELLKNNPKVSFCVVGKANPLPDKFSIEYSSAIVFGTAGVLGDEQKLEILISFVEKYSGDFLEKGKEYAVSAQNKCLIIKIDCQKVTGKARKA